MNHAKQYKSRKICLDGGIGRRAGLKIQFFEQSEGSTPSPGTTQTSKFWACVMLMR